MTTGAPAESTGFDCFFFNSIVIASVSVLLALAIGTLAAYGFSRYPDGNWKALAPEPRREGPTTCADRIDSIGPTIGASGIDKAPRSPRIAGMVVGNLSDGVADARSPSTANG